MGGNTCCCQSFNPRPPLLAGESLCRHHARRHGVSIHARHCWRANLSVSLAQALNWSVSIHARHCWRANLGVGGPNKPKRRVSIHARHCWRANQGRCICFQASQRFQSTPAIAGGRIYRVGGSGAYRDGFNPRPPLLAGESLNCRASARRSWCFNPRPPLLAGESGLALSCVPGRFVSIHARHCWRANLHR